MFSLLRSKTFLVERKIKFGNPRLKLSLSLAEATATKLFLLSK